MSARAFSYASATLHVTRIWGNQETPPWQLRKGSPQRPPNSTSCRSLSKCKGCDSILTHPTYLSTTTTPVDLPCYQDGA